ncbi:hypothetical protein RhiJN_20818 [Ceratobasidium sp. AG-Ba]|nr:hypothetical protein RhiJN_20818 [Ceratobasidium sp. AG-Ba]
MSQQHLRDAIESLSRDSAHILSVIGPLPRDSEQVTNFWLTFDEEIASIMETDGSLFNSSITGVTRKRNQVAPSPICRLPEHILAMIFEMVVDAAWSQVRFYKTPLALSSVRAHWRAVSLETRMIWRYVTLDLGIRRETSTNHGPGTFLKKASGAPIFLIIGVDENPELFDVQYTSSALATRTYLLNQFMDAWGSHLALHLLD